jgi:sec-independent protein translocase protein TatB
MSINQLLVVFLVALIVFGPEKLPMLATHLGKLCRKVTAFKNMLATEFEKAEQRQQALDKNLKKALDADQQYKKEHNGEH